MPISYDRLGVFQNTLLSLKLQDYRPSELQNIIALFLKILQKLDILTKMEDICLNLVFTSR